MTTSTVVNDVIHGLDELILRNLKGVAQEQYFPCPDADEMDDRIALGKKRAKELRRLREEFEDICTGVL